MLNQNLYFNNNDPRILANNHVQFTIHHAHLVDYNKSLCKYNTHHVLAVTKPVRLEQLDTFLVYYQLQQLPTAQL